MWCGDSVYMPLLTERERQEFGSYKHVAPPEQEPSIPTTMTFRAKPVEPVCTKVKFRLLALPRSAPEERHVYSHRRK